MGEDALELFVDRAGLAAPDYALTRLNVEPIGRICSQLAGLPLAVELAATWIRILSPRDLADRLVDVTRAASPTSRVDGRHQNLQAVIASSWAWLGPAEREVATALGVFRGGFTCEAAEVVAGATLATLAALADRAMIQRLPDPTGGTRYQMHELLRVHATTQLTAGDPAWAHAIRLRHFDHFLGLADAAGAAGRTWVDPSLDGPFALERANLNAAFSWAVERDDAERALRILDALDAFWPYSIPPTSARTAHLSRALDLSWDAADRGTRMARAKALNRLGYIVFDSDRD
jgi:predicted ATPase